MNCKFRKFVAATTLIAVSSVSMPLAALAQDNTAYVDTPAQDVAQTAVYLPIRAALSAAGVGVDWLYDWNGQRVVLTYGGQSVTVNVDAQAALLYTPSGDAYTYSNINGSLQAPLEFFQALFNNASVTANGAGGIYVTAVDASQAITLVGAASDSTTPSTPEDNYTYYESGLATWYGSGAQGNYTASGEIFNMYDYTAAHKYLPFGTICRVTDTESGKSVIVRINDRGPFGAGRVIDLSYQAASDLGIVSKGVAPVTVEILS